MTDAPFLGGAFEASFDCVVVADCDGRIVDINPAAVASFGHRRSAAIGRTIADLLVPPELSQLYQSEWTSFWTGEDSQVAGRHVRTEIVCADGGRVPVESSLGRVATDAGDFAIVSLRDVSKVAELEGEAKRTAQLFAAFTRNAPVGMYVKNGKGEYILVNERMARSFETTPEKIIGKTVRDMLPPGEAAMIEGYDREILTTRKTKAVVEKIEPLGEYEWTLVVRFPLETDDDPDMIGGFEIDVTPQKRAEEELARSRERLNQAERMTALGSLLAGVSHELNNPLAIVVGEATLLEEDAEGTEMEEGATRIRAAAERCARIVQSFLAMARQKPAERDKLGVNAIISAVMELTEYQMRANDISVERDLIDGLPRIHGDADQLQQVIINLLINAQQALQSQNPPRTIRVSTFAEGDQVAIRVEDNGPGIPDEVALRVFDPFFTTKPEGTGTGIGLSYSQGVIEAHGGTLELERDRDGASFLIRLPVNPDDQDSALDRSDAITKPGEQAQGRALVIDDEPDLAAAIARLLRREGFDTDVAHDGEKAVEYLEAKDYDLLLCDLRMPKMDGASIHGWLQANRPTLISRLGFVTGDTLSPAAVTFLDNARRPYIAKPVTREALGNLIAKLKQEAMV
ncbi:hybrid sensor histidine kinase/response regulator [Sphingomicrobium clamense]|uniref:histidine kinase n=1 Tax=Sphingomicrobium clamense TaxID=2851013 RepID=A0ABS6V3H0_9SPHN|nr:PAS domain-containing protein [Sphingomicrobium sp. B8]MBW0144041.1 PAS domain-containing protein [Sphingomicrobium sp. B8]